MLKEIALTPEESLKPGNRVQAIISRLEPKKDYTSWNEIKSQTRTKAGGIGVVMPGAWCIGKEMDGSNLYISRLFEASEEECRPPGLDPCPRIGDCLIYRRRVLKRNIEVEP